MPWGIKPWHQTAQTLRQQDLLQQPAPSPRCPSWSEGRARGRGGIAEPHTAGHCFRPCTSHARSAQAPGKRTPPCVTAGPEGAQLVIVRLAVQQTAEKTFPSTRDLHIQREETGQEVSEVRTRRVHPRNTGEYLIPRIYKMGPH